MNLPNFTLDYEVSRQNLEDQMLDEMAEYFIKHEINPFFNTRQEKRDYVRMAINKYEVISEFMARYDVMGSWSNRLVERIISDFNV